MRAPRGLIIVVLADEAVLRLPAPIFQSVAYEGHSVTSAAISVDFQRCRQHRVDNHVSAGEKKELVPRFRFHGAGIEVSGEFRHRGAEVAQSCIAGQAYEVEFLFCQMAFCAVRNGCRHAGCRRFAEAVS